MNDLQQDTFIAMHSDTTSPTIQQFAAQQVKDRLVEDCSFENHDL